jgi:superfamily II DNA/RNA helicase
MLDMGFIDEIKYFLSCLPKQRQSLFFSATMPDKIRMLVESFSVDPFTVQVRSGDTSANVEQDVIKVDGGSKMLILQSLLSQPELEKVLIFGETKRQVEKLTTDLIQSGYKAESIHGDKRQGQRQKALDSFKTNKIDILVATDVAARGLDIKDVTHVINYTVPQTYDDYVHRIGRTGRGNALGKALTFVE